MKLRNLFLITVLLSISVAGASADQQFTTTTIKSDDQRIGVEIPADLSAGYHSVAVEATDPITGEVRVENLDFCKDLEGNIHWEGSCGVITILAPQKTLEATKEREKLPAYDPISQPKKNVDIQIAAFAALTVLAAGGVVGGLAGLESGALEAPLEPRDRIAARREDIKDGSSKDVVLEEGESGKEKQDLETIDSEQLRKYEREKGRGDLLGTWQLPLTPFLDSAFIVGAHHTSRFSPLLSRIFYDGNYLRAMIGSVAAALHPIGILLGFFALKSVDAQALPPTWTLFSAVMVLGVFDAFAGFLAAALFFLGVLATGHLGSRDELLTVVGTVAIFFAPALIASAFRPLRREVRDAGQGWERLTDYLLAAILTGWTVSKMVGSLTGLAGIQLPITAFGFRLGAIAAIAVLVRMAGEDFATYIYPVRLADLHPELQRPGKIQLTFSMLFKTAVFAFLAEPFIGNSLQLWLGILLFILPKLLALTVAPKFPKSGNIFRGIPKGALKIVVMVFVGTIFGRWVQSQYQDPDQFVKWGFVILGLPGLLLQFLGFFADRSAETNWKHSGKGRLIYRFGGIAIFFLIVEMALGKNLVDLVLGK